MHAMRAHLIQLNSVWESRSINLARAGGLVAGAAPNPGDFLALPEMFDTGFSVNTAVTADWMGETRAWISETAKLHRCWVQAGLTEGTSEGCANVALVADPSGEVVGRYAKTRLFPTETGAIVPGDGARVVNMNLAEGARGLCPLICYDLRFPELFGDGLSMGAQMFCVSACWPKVRVYHWRALLIARAIENQAIVLGVTRCGHEPTVEYAGGTIAVGPKGDVLGELGAEEGVLSVELPWGDVDSWRRSFSAWRQRRGPG